MVNHSCFVSGGDSQVKGSAKVAAPAKNAQYTPVTTTAENGTWADEFISLFKVTQRTN
jgi:hypothetical protein